MTKPPSIWTAVMSFFVRQGPVKLPNCFVADPDDVALHERGRQQADAMCEFFSGVTIDRAICSGLRRTRETASRVLGKRDLAIEIHAGFAEIRPPRDDRSSELDLIDSVAFSHWRATESPPCGRHGRSGTPVDEIQKLVALH